MPHTSLRGRRHHDCTHGRLLYAAVHFAFVLTSLTPAAAAETDPTSDQNPFLPAPGTHAGWTFLRGPDYDGHSPEIHLADSWPEDGPPVLWTRELGQGYSAFAASGRRVYTQAQTLGGQFVYCLDAETGETLWEYRYAWPYEPLGVYPGPRSSPTLAGGHVYFTGPDGLTGCLTAGKGQLVWQRNVVEEYHGRGGTGFGYSCTPVVIDGLVILPVGGKSASMVALDATDGSEVWAAGNDPASYSPAFPIELGGRKLVVGYLENSLVLHDRLTGELLFRQHLSQGYDEHSAWPIYREPYLWTSGPFRSGSRLMQLPAELSGKAAAGAEPEPPAELHLEHVWQSTMLSNDVTSSVLVGDSIYGFDIFDVQSKTQRPSRGMFRCLDFLTGEERWSRGTGRPQRGTTADPEEIGQSGIIAADGKLILLTERGELLLLEATPESCNILARATILGGELTWTPPALHRGRVYVRNHSRAACIYIGEPDLLQTEQPVLTVDQIPQTRYFDLAARLLSVEPEYMFDVPSLQWQLQWFAASLGILAAAGLLGLLLSCTVPAPLRVVVRWRTYLVTAFVLGAAGTTFLSQITRDFVFTWHVCLFIAFEPVMAGLRLRRQPTGSTQEVPQTGRWQERLTLLWFAAVCAAYFLLCRRLSLVFEWPFLMGFVGAMPFLWFRNQLPPGRWRTYAISPMLTALAFTGFTVCGCLSLWLRY
ncbi:MAG: PQQ-like beta-propeller repeat protein [Planctomycetaceae bacterium]|nr:PQQ-like beta-propeller repeat protein [Planctomycetaceae bacterium]